MENEPKKGGGEKMAWVHPALFSSPKYQSRNATFWSDEWGAPQAQEEKVFVSKAVRLFGEGFDFVVNAFHASTGDAVLGVV
jgi:hypothetical protein